VTAVPPQAVRTTSSAPPAVGLVGSKNRQRLGYRRIVQLLVYLVIIPTVLLLLLGIVLTVTGERKLNVVLGILTIAFVAVSTTGVILVLVFVRREANLSELQADFVSKVSHELRTPLTAIRLFAETIERNKQDEDTVAKCLTLLTTETERLTRRIERLLDWGRMEAGRKLYDLKDEAVADVIDEAVKAFPTARLAEDIELKVDVEPGLPLIFADRHAMVDAIVNLLTNAQKYGGAPPTIRLEARRTPQGRVSITVTDNGAGIPRPEIRRIFDKFYRIDDRLSRRAEGSGLGLAIVKHVARAHKAKVNVETAPGHGSTFAIVLPPADPRRQRPL
jgi:two-component system, OmpR family, phosphate regulon sensor histidine kinase PhoR